MQCTAERENLAAGLYHFGRFGIVASRANEPVQFARDATPRLEDAK
jgi:hypothetical protein